MKQNGKPLDYLGNVELFASTMEERFAGEKNTLTIIASDGTGTYDLGFGTNEDIIDALTTALYNDDELFSIVQIALAQAISNKYNSADDDTD